MDGLGEGVIFEILVYFNGFTGFYEFIYVCRHWSLRGFGYSVVRVSHRI